MYTSTRPSLRFFYSAALRTRSKKVLTALERDRDPTRHVGALSSLVVDLTEVGLDYYFLRPLRQGKVGFVARRTASLALASTLGIMSPIIRTILAGRTTTELKVIARHMRQLM